MKKKSFLDQTGEIEILDFDEPVKYEKKIKWKTPKYVTACVASIIMLLILSVCITGKNTITSSAKKVLNGLGVYTEEIKSVEIISDHYDDPGSWHIDKSAEWIGTNKAQVSFDVNTIMKTSDHYKDIVLVLDISGSMRGEKIEKVKSDTIGLVESVLSNNQNRIALITFESASTIISDFTNDKDDLINKIDSIVTTGNTNYNAALQNVDVIMNNYRKETNRNVITLFLTDGYPNEDTPNQIGTYEILKDKYPYMTINGVQYEMGKDIIDEIKKITDAQWVADRSTLNNVLFEASVSSVVYEEFIITDYIHDEYFKIESINEIKVTKGTVTLEEESGLQKITWNLGKGFATGGNEKMTIIVSLKEQYANTEDFYPTNKKEKIEYKLSEDTEKTTNSTKTPVLKSSYDVIYEANTPDDCTLPDIPKEKHFVFQNVNIKTEELFCDGYSFKGWKIDFEDEKDITKVNDDVFIMPSHDVTIRGTWTKQSIEKSMDGKVFEKTTLYKVLQEEAEEGEYAKEYTGAHQDSIDPSKSTEKIYHYYASDDEKGTEIANRNNVIFAGQCWQMIRTTDTGGVKLFYNGEEENGQCLNTRGNHVGYEGFASIRMSSSYWYGTDYTYDNVNKTFTISGTTIQEECNESTAPKLIGKYTCQGANIDDSCTTLYEVISHKGGDSVEVMKLIPEAVYSGIGPIMYNLHKASPKALGYMYYDASDDEDYNSYELPKSENIVYKSTLSTSYWYSAVAVWGSPVANRYNLSNPYRPTRSSEFPFLIHRYTFRNSNKTYTSGKVQFITAVNGSTMYYLTLGDTTNHEVGDVDDRYVYGNSYTNNGDGTYTINYPTTVKRSEWYTNYTRVGESKYVCKNATNYTCSDLWVVVSTTDTTLYFERIADLETYKFAKGFTYDENTRMYTLSDESINIDSFNRSENRTALNNAHYTCWNQSGECTRISYVSYVVTTPNVIVYYFKFSNGKGINDFLDEILGEDSINETDSNIKRAIDMWYKKTLLDYDDYIEDTIFCNDRSIRSLGGWDPNGGNVTEKLLFKESTPTTDLSCTNIKDRFSVSNPKAQLTYKIGLITVPELNLLNNNNARVTLDGVHAWLMSPKYFSTNSVINTLVARGNFGDSIPNFANRNARPAISLKPGVEYMDGDGTMTNPYIIDTNN